MGVVLQIVFLHLKLVSVLNIFLIIVILWFGILMKVLTIFLIELIVLLTILLVYEDRTCHRPTTECTNAIKGFLCLYFSPQCSSNGYQMNMCQDYCFEVAKQCDILPETNVIGFNCYATFFNEGSAGSCYSNSTFTSTPEEFNPRQFFEDNANPDTVAQPIPAITTTYFPPVVATMPPLILDDDDGLRKI